MGLPLYSLDGITYTETIPTATNAGVYVVYVKVEDNEKYTGIEPISINVKIGKAIAQISKPPVANEKLSYNTQEQELVKGGKVNIGFISFSLDGKTYSKTIPTAIAPGNYTVYYKIMETDNYTGVEAESIDVTINKGSRYYRNKPLSIKDLHYTGEAQALISEGEIIEGIILYSLDGTNYSENIPTAIEVGEYTVYYKVDPTDNYNGIEPQTLKVVIDAPTPIASVENIDTIKVWSSNRTIFIESAPDTKYTIIDLNGRIIKSATTKSTKEEIRIDKLGVYIVVIGNDSYKVSLR